MRRHELESFREGERETETKERLRSVRSVLSETVSLLKIESMSKVGACKYPGSSSYFAPLHLGALAELVERVEGTGCHLEIQLDESRRR